jgi:hypothetical protein
MHWPRHGGIDDCDERRCAPWDCGGGRSGSLGLPAMVGRECSRGRDHRVGLGTAASIDGARALVGHKRVMVRGNR